ncbi:glutathione S-transferase T3-like [Alnus glutinosa]|uniref:glutathione S-transferase T3-like n=1 Tax=Alnus glutinosa TaxID=3517 RepID=UPI002D7942D3|nr:glutathione S-transferase T3-like [Alnus glutinosa]
MDSRVQGDVSFIDLLQGNADMDNSFLDKSQQASMSIDHSQPQVVMARTKKPQRGTNFSMEEDKLLVSSWLNVGMDAVQGANQKYRQFWERVHKYFNEHKEFPFDRIYSSLMNRWSTIQKLVIKFTACLSQIEHLNQSGTTEHDRIQKAKCVYRSENNNVAFPYEHYSINEDEGDNVSHGNNVDFERPIGRKAEKAKRKRKEGPSEDVVEFMKRKTECIEEARV